MNLLFCSQIAKELVDSENTKTNTAEMPKILVCNDFIFRQSGKNDNECEVCANNIHT